MLTFKNYLDLIVILLECLEENVVRDHLLEVELF